MPHCIVFRTHHKGRRQDRFTDSDGVPGPVIFGSLFAPELNRHVECLRVRRGHFRDGRPRPDALPPLCEPKILTLNTEMAMMVSGFEQVDGRRHYQGWYIRWVDNQAPAEDRKIIASP